MLINSLQQLFTRDLNKLKEEIALYKDESNLWRTDKNISNSAGNLCLHLAGNLKTFIGAVIGETGYVRNRPEEFAAKNIPKEVLIKSIDEVISVVEESLQKLPEESLEKEYPVQVFDKPLTYEQFLLHLSGHLMYHLGQINYHRRLLDHSEV
jgi:uncharacterized damage-inducible protein DinB